MTASERVSNAFFRPYPGPLAIYLHFPFCTNRCHYCDFYREPFDPETAELLFRAIIYETEMVLLSLGQEPVDIASIYIGGGTPSLLPPRLLEEWIARVKGYARFMVDYEFSIEVNPESLTDEFACRSREAGVNRIIVGVQSFATGALRQLNRRQTTRDIYRAFYRARLAGYENIAADLIFGLPGQTMKKMRTDIDRLIALEPTHISFYQLTVEQTTRLADRVAAGEMTLPDEESLAAMYRFGSHMLIDRTYRRYEVSNFALDGRRSRHNYAYWSGSPYLGLGPSAHGFVNNCRYGNVADIKRYIEAVDAGFMPIEFVEKLTDEQRLLEAVMLSLRTSDGIDKVRQKLRFGKRAEAIFASPISRRYVDSGHLIDERGFLRLSDEGFLLADKIIADLVGWA